MGQSAAWRERFDVATARATAPLNVLLELALPFLRVGGRLLAMKGARVHEEIAAAEDALSVLGGERSALYENRSPSGARSAIVEITKTAPTPARYPRAVGIPKKRPIDNSR